MTAPMDQRPRPRRRRPPTRGLLFGASLDRVPATPAGRLRPGTTHGADVVVPIALIGEGMPVAPPRVAPFGSMAAAWPLVDRPADPVAAAPPALPERRAVPAAGPPSGGVERRLGGLSGSEWDRMLGR